MFMPPPGGFLAEFGACSCIGPWQVQFPMIACISGTPLYGIPLGNGAFKDEVVLP